MRYCTIFSTGATFLTVAAGAETLYRDYILAPSSRTLRPQVVHQTGGNVQDPAKILSESGRDSTVFTGEGSYVTLDFGKNIAGPVSFNVQTVNGESEAIGMTFTESSEWISAEYCDATQDAGRDLPLWFNLTGPGVYEADKTHQRGGFRYLTIVHNSTGSVSISNLTVYWPASPELEDPTTYAGYFHSDSEKLNRVWYAGAYTNQLCTIDPTTGNSLGLPLSEWSYDYVISNGTSVLVDGAKRDRLIWPGDIAISGPSMFVSTGNLDPIRNGIDALIRLQQEDGRLPYAGDPFQDFVRNMTASPDLVLWSFTYHCHTLNDIYDYYLFTGDIKYLQSVWDQFTLGMNYLLQFIDSSGLANVTSTADWLRFGMGGHNIEANSILYFTLRNALKLSVVLNDNSEVSKWTEAASGIPAAANELLWDESVSLFKDNDTSQVLHPQDGNAWAIVSGIVNGSRASAISDALASRWVRPYGAPAPEAGQTVSPFVSGFEIQAHYLVGRADRAVDLMEFMWADFMLDDPRMTNSSFIEGYSTTGSLHYAPYLNDERVSHAHGWATGPTSTLSFLAAGVKLTSAAGVTWQITPRLGGLHDVEAGFETPIGCFSVSWQNDTSGFRGTFEAPASSTGSVEIALALDSQCLTLSGPGGNRTVDVSTMSTVTVDDLPGGQYSVMIT